MELTTDYLGTQKFKDIDRPFHDSIQELLADDPSKVDLIHQFPIYVGHVNLARHLFLYDLYQRVAGLSGHIADIGTWKGASFLFFAKLLKIFEPQGSSQVHGLDWFEGMTPAEGLDDMEIAGKYQCSFETLKRQVEVQALQDVALIHKVDLTTELPDFFERYPFLRFKLIFMDCGIASVLEASLQEFWPRLVTGGILILDHYNSDASPSETRLVEKHVGNHRIQAAPWNRQPTAFVVKEERQP